MKKIVSLVLAVCLMCSAACAGTILDGLFPGFRKQETVTIPKDEYERLRKYEKIDEIYDYIDKYYYQEPDKDDMMVWAIDGMLASLQDPYTYYYTEEDWTTLWEEDEGKYAGIGIQMMGNYNTGIVTVSRVFRDTPAQEAGVQRGDELIRVEDLEITAQTMNQGVQIMRGKEDEVVEIEVVRKGEHIIFHIPRAQINVNWIDSKLLDNNIGYLWLYEFSGDCAETFKKELEKLEKEGATALILDLRDNGGGWTDDAQSIADIFLDETLLYYTEDRSGNREEYCTTEGKDTIPLVVLVNENSASSSEILSGALQDTSRARIVGTKTYGKGIIQAVIPLSDGKDGFQFTIGQYFLPSGTPVHGVGITPDVVVELPEEMTGELFDLGSMDDPQLKKAWEEAISLRDAEERVAADAGKTPNAA